MNAKLKDFNELLNPLINDLFMLSQFRFSINVHLKKKHFAYFTIQNSVNILYVVTLFITIL